MTEKNVDRSCQRTSTKKTKTHLLTVEFVGPVRQVFYRKIVIIFLPNSLKICLGCSKELSH